MIKKLMVLLLACCAFGACEQEDLADYLISEQDNPHNLYEFPAVDDGAPLSFHLIRHMDDYESTGQTEVNTYVETEGYSKRMLVIATYDSALKKSETQAPYFDRLAEHFKDTDMEFAIIFLDFDKEHLASLPWVQNLQHVRAFHNTQSPCPNADLCLYVLESISTDGPQLHYIVKDKASLYHKYAAWPDTENEEELEQAYQKMLNHTQKFLNKFSSDQ